MFLTGPVVAASFFIRSVVLGKLMLLVVGVLNALLHRVPTLLVDGVALPALFVESASEIY